MLEQLEKLDPEIIIHFKKTGESEAIKKDLQNYILQIDFAAKKFHSGGGINPTAKKLQVLYPILSFQTARQRVYDAIEYFHLNNTVSEEAWNNYYADRMEMYAKKALKDDDIQEARRCSIMAREYRMASINKSIDPATLKPKNNMLSIDITAERLGLPEKNLKKLWPETYKFINSIDKLEDRQRDDLLKEAKLNMGKHAEDIDYDEG